MSASQWEMDTSDIDRLFKNIEKISDRSETVINKRLKEKSGPAVLESIQKDIPVSSWKGRVMKKKHAHDSKSLSTKYDNLSFTIRPASKFNYLKYPDLGIGTSKGKPQQFMKKSFDKVVPKIVSDLNTTVVNEINKTLGE